MDENAPKTVDEYLALCPAEHLQKLHELRRIIRETAPEAVEKISWAMPTFVYHGNLCHFAANKKHIGFYPGENGVAHFSSALTQYHTSKGAIQFPYEKPLPVSLIQEIVRFRMEENKALAEAKKGRGPR